MTLAELIKLTRLRLRDDKAPYLFSDEELTDFLNSAVVEAAERARLIYDDSDTTVTKITVTANKQTYDLHPSIRFIELVEINTNTQDGTGKFIYSPLAKLSEAELSIYGMRPEDTIYSSLPTNYILRGSTITLIPIPVNNSDLRLSVYRLPLESEYMTYFVDEPVIPSEYHRHLVHWAVYEALSSMDADVVDPTRAERELTKFEQIFGRRPTARAQRAMWEGKGGARVYPRSF